MFSADLLGKPTDAALPPASDFVVYAEGEVIERILVTKTFRTDLSIQTGSLKQPLKVMETCLDDLLTRWGVDAPAHRTLTRRAEPNWSDRWLSVTVPMQRDFLTMKDSNRQDVRLIIDQAGKPAECRVLNWPEDEPIAQRLCEALLKDAVIPPALDSQSRPIESYYVLTLSAIARVEYRP